MIYYEDASDSSDDRVDYPEYVQSFVDIGFVQIGRVLAKDKYSSFAELAEAHGELAPVAAEKMTIPTPVLRSPDSDGFVEVSWFWDSPSIRIRTALAGDLLVETLRRWDHAPPTERSKNIDAIMTRSHAPDRGRSVLVVQSSDAAELWAAHLRHLAKCRETHGYELEQHRDLGDFIRIATAAFRTELRPLNLLRLGWLQTTGVDAKSVATLRPRRPGWSRAAGVVLKTLLIALLVVTALVAAVLIGVR